jgi:hypothetical protein
MSFKTHIMIFRHADYTRRSRYEVTANTVHNQIDYNKQKAPKASKERPHILMQT